MIWIIAHGVTRGGTGDRKWQGFRLSASFQSHCNLERVHRIAVYACLYLQFNGTTWHILFQAVFVTLFFWHYCSWTPHYP